MEFSKRLAISLLLTVAFVSACGSGSDGMSSDGIDSDVIGSDGISSDAIDSTATNNPTIQETNEGNFSAIAGVWDESENYDGVIDVVYWVINADGTFANVDYRGDDFDNEANCYHYFRGRVTTLGTNGYVFDRGGNNSTSVIPIADGAAIITTDSSQVLYYMTVINGELALMDESNGPPYNYLPPVLGGLDPSIPECPPEAG